MLPKPTTCAGLVLPLLLVGAATGAEALPPATQWIPPNAVIVVELSKPEALLDVALEPKVEAAIASQPAYQKMTETPQFKELEEGIRYLERSLRTDWRTGLRKLVSGGVTWSVHPGGGSLLIVDADSEPMLNQLHEIARGIAQVEAAKQGNADRVQSKEYRDVTAWTFNGKEAHALVGKRLLITNKKELLKAALDLRASEGTSLSDVAGYRAARKAAGTGAAATAYVNFDILKHFPPIQKALEPNTNPLASLLLAGTTETLRHATWLSLALRVEGEELRLDIATDGKSEASKLLAFAAPAKPDEGALPNLAVPRRIAAMSFFRDLHGFYAAKDELFPERTSGLIFFENMMGIFFTGRDLTEEVLGETGPAVRVVVAQQEYGPETGTPQVQVPAFAAVFQLNNADKFAVVAEEAWQKALGLVNFTQGQQAKPGLIIDRQTHAGTKYTVASYSAPSKKTKNVEIRYNFSPSLARQGDFIILSSTAGLARDLIDAIQKETEEHVRAVAQVHSLIELDASQLGSILRANRENLIRQNMVEDGHTRDEAETQIDMLTTIVKYLGQAKLQLAQREGRAQATLTVKLNLPKSN